MNGLKLLQTLCGGTRTKAVGFILMTGTADKALIDKGRQLGMNNCLKIPFEPAQLRGCIEAVVGRL